MSSPITYKSVFPKSYMPNLISFNPLVFVFLSGIVITTDT